MTLFIERGPMHKVGHQDPTPRVRLMLTQRYTIISHQTLIQNLKEGGGEARVKKNLTDLKISRFQERDYETEALHV